MTISYSKQLYSNNASTELLYGIGPEDTSISVIDASKFPSPGSAEFFTATLDDGINIEIVRVGSVAGNSLAQLTRGIEGSTPRQFNSGTMVEARLTSAAIRDFARTLDIMTPVGLVTDLAAPETLNDHSYVIAEGDDTGSPIVATVGGNVWHLLNYPIQRVSQESTVITSTSVEYTSVDDLSTVFTPKGLVVQFVTGANRGQCRLVTTATSSTLSWSTPLVNPVSSGDAFTVSQSIASKFQTFIGVDVVTLTQVNTAVEDGISAHVAASDPHTQYTTDAEATTIANSAVSAHVALIDPHTQYTTDAEATTIANSSASSVVSAHVAASDPHTQYTTDAEATTIANSAASSAVSAHVAASNPHSQYITIPGLGDGQDWNVSPAYAYSTYYPNTTGRSILVNVLISTIGGVGDPGTWGLTVKQTSGAGSPAVVSQCSTYGSGIDTGTHSTMSAVIPNGYSFSVVPTGVLGTMSVAVLS